jgi:hypothetical protein
MKWTCPDTKNKQKTWILDTVFLQDTKPCQSYDDDGGGGGDDDDDDYDKKRSDGYEVKRCLNLQQGSDTATCMHMYVHVQQICLLCYMHTCTSS